jgi:hypothetical protein
MHTRAIPAPLLALVALALLGFGPALVRAQDATPMAEAPPAATRPNEGWALHIDTKLHFPGDPQAIAHHWCKPVAGGMFQCLIFTSDAPDARLVAVETIVDPATYNAFDAAEQQLWHYHKEELPRIEATLPDLSAEEAAAVVPTLEETYGKLYLLWDPTVDDRPVGQPEALRYLGEATPTP